jgi:hypothetical protein
MFFPDMQLAAREMIRVLKPGGRIATSVWNVAEKNFWITATMGAINRNIDLPLPLPGAPGMFRCAKDGLMEDIFRQAGFKNIAVTEVIGQLNCRTADVYWNVMNEVAAPVVAALSNAGDALREKIKTEVFRAIHERFRGEPVQISGSSLIIYGEK